AGYYQIRASHRGCRAVRGDAAFGLTPVLAIPPPRKNLLIELRCKKLKRVATKLKLKSVGSKGYTGGLIQAAITIAHGHRVPPATELPGEVTFRIPGIGSRTVPVDVRHG